MFNTIVPIYAVGGMAVIPTHPLLVTPVAAWWIVGIALFVACGLLWLIVSTFNPTLPPGRHPATRRLSRPRSPWPTAPAQRSSRA